MKPKGQNKKAKLDPKVSESKKLDASPKPTASAELLAVAKMKAAVTAAASSSTNLSLAQQQSSLAAAAAAIQDRPSYPTFAVLDFAKDFPRMAGVISASKLTNNNTDVIAIEEVDSIQAELETLWSSISVRIRSLQKEKELLQFVTGTNSHHATLSTTAGLLEHYDLNHQEKINAVKSIIDSGHGTRTSVSAAAALVLGVTTPNATSAVQAAAAAATTPVLVGSNRKSNNSIAAAIKLEKQPKKKLKGESGSGKRASSSGIGSLPANRFTQNRSHSLSLDDYNAEAPNQFWQYSDAYCHDITTENLETLSKIVEEERKDIPSNLMEIPSLGKYYLDQEEFAGFKKQKTRQEKSVRDNDIAGPLTQRLVAALVEDRIAAYNGDSGSVINGTTNGVTDFKGNFMSRTGLVKTLGLDKIGNPSTGAGLESRVKHLLLEQGLLLGDESADDPDLPEDDEILREIKKTQSDLIKLRKHNLGKLEELHKMGKDANAKIALKEELAKADKEVLESYKFVHSSRVKKKPIAKKDRDIAFKAVQNREVALDKLGAIKPIVVAKSNGSK